MKPRVAVVAIATALVIGGTWFVLRSDDVHRVGEMPASEREENRPTAPSIAAAERSSIDGERAATGASSGELETSTPAALEDITVVRLRAIDPNGDAVRLATMYVGSIGRDYARLGVEPVPDLPAARGDDAGCIEWTLDRVMLVHAGFDPASTRSRSATLVVSAPAHRPAQVQIRLAFGDLCDLGDVVLEPGGVVRGRVFDAGGAPAAGALVGARSPTAATVDAARRSVFGLPPPWVRCDAGGSFRLDGVPREVVCIIAVDDVDRFAPSNPFGHSKPIDLRSSAEIADVVVALDAGPARDDTIHGVVVTGDGTPAPNMFVEIEGQNTPDLAVAFAARVSLAGNFRLASITGADGTFTLACAPEFAARLRGTPLSIRVRDPAARLAERLVAPVVLGQVDLVVTLDVARTFEVTCVDDRHEPLPGCSVEVSNSPDWRAVGPEQLDLSADAHCATLHASSTTFYVHVSHRGHRRTMLGPFDPLAPPASVEAALKRDPAITGVVVVDGAPVADALVSCFLTPAPFVRAPMVSPIMLRAASIHVDEPIDSARTAADGSFSVFAWQPLDDPTAQPPAAPMLAIHKAGSASAVVALPERAWREAHDVGVVALEPGCTLTGRVAGIPGGDRITLSAGEGRVLVVPLNDDGSFQIDHLRGGPWRVALLARGRLTSALSRAPARAPSTLDESALHESVSEWIEVPAAGTMHVELTVEPAPAFVRCALTWGTERLDPQSCLISAKAADDGSVVRSPLRWNFDQALRVPVRRAGAFTISLLTRIAGNSNLVAFSDTIELTPGAITTWRVDAQLATIDVPPPPGLMRNDRIEGFVQTVRPGCFALIGYWRNPSGAARVACLPGIGRRIDATRIITAFPTPEQLESAPTLDLIDTTAAQSK